MKVERLLCVFLAYYIRFMKKMLFGALLLILSAQAFAGDKAEKAIRQLLTNQVAQWNQGNISGYMHGYWEDDSLLFIGKSGPRYGYENTLANYKKGYPDTAHMGKLISTVISVKRLSRRYYFVVGKWELIRSVGNVSGSYTLLLRKIKGEWVIVADHSS